MLRAYAGTNPGEFFAVATETFFTRPLPMEEDKPALYGVLAAFYRQDPAERVRRATGSAADPACYSARISCTE